MSFRLPKRKGEKPITDNVIPHSQYSQNSSHELIESLSKWLFSLEYIQKKDSLISVRGTPGAFFKADVNGLNTAALLVDREFTHIHPQPLGGSQHLALPQEDALEVVSKGWGEEHPLLKTGQLCTHTIMVYAARDEEDLGVIKTITKRAYDFALNRLN